MTGPEKQTNCIGPQFINIYRGIIRECGGYSSDTVRGMLRWFFCILFILQRLPRRLVPSPYLPHSHFFCKATSPQNEDSTQAAEALSRYKDRPWDYLESEGAKVKFKSYLKLSHVLTCGPGSSSLPKILNPSIAPSHLHIDALYECVWMAKTLL